MADIKLQVWLLKHIFGYWNENLGYLGGVYVFQNNIYKSIMNIYTKIKNPSNIKGKRLK